MVVFSSFQNSQAPLSCQPGRLLYGKRGEQGVKNTGRVSWRKFFRPAHYCRDNCPESVPSKPECLRPLFLPAVLLSHLDLLLPAPRAGWPLARLPAVSRSER